MIPVYDEDGTIVAEVEANTNLDYWDGHNYTCGHTGRHRGLTQLESGEYVLIHSTQWVGERDYGEIVTPAAALAEILRSRNLELLDQFPDLAALRERTIKKERVRT